MFKDSVRTTQYTLPVSITTTCRLMLCKEIVAVSVEIVRNTQTRSESRMHGLFNANPAATYGNHRSSDG